MTLKKWIIGQPNRDLAKELAEECDVDPFAALIACTRGIDDAASLEQLLCDEPLLCDPRELPDIEEAADYIRNAIESDTLIAVFGDYDCDGVMATAIMKDYLSSIGARVVTYIPDREKEGYGMNCGAVDRLHAMGVGLIITVDNGICCNEEIAYAASLGIKTVITDHHLPPEELPLSLAVVDPHLKGSNVSFKDVCGAVVAFKLVCVLDDKEPEELLYRYADMLCVATVADVMPLVNENRCVVKAGLEKLKEEPNLGLFKLMNVAGIKRDEINASKVAFGIAPRINAAGRMGDASRALDLVLCEDETEAERLAEILNSENTDRRDGEKEIFEQAQRQINAKGLCHHRVIVVSGDGWHAGTIGIVASRLTEKYGKPSIVITVADGEAHGSGRSLKGFNLHDALCASCEHLTKFGGHELAAGISLAPDKIDDFRTAINEYARSRQAAIPEIRLDFKLNPLGMSVSMAHIIEQLEPFGFGNPTPVFGIFEAKLEKINVIGSGKHLKLLFSKGGGAFQALLFGVTPDEFCFECGDMLDLAVTLDVNIYKEVEHLSVQIKALRISGTQQDGVFEDIVCFDDFASGAAIDAKRLFPTREEVGVIYKEILHSPIKYERLKHIYMNSPGYAKTQTALKVLSELSLISYKDGIVFAAQGVGKTDLMRSKTYKELFERVGE